MTNMLAPKLFKNSLIAALYLLILMSGLIGCDSRKEPANAEKVATKPTAPVFPQTNTLFSEPIQPVLTETALEAIPTWRETHGEATLVLLSNTPLLRPIPPDLVDRAVQLAETGNLSEIQTAGARPTANPLVFEDMTLELVLHTKLFKRVVWILPLTKALPIEAFKEQVAASGVMSKDEVESFGAGSNGCFTGKVREAPMDVCSIDYLPTVQGPVVLHWEMSFFREVYKDEIKTPTYSLLGEIAGKLRKTQWPVAVATINRSSLGQETTLATRFLADHVGQIISQPKLLNSPKPPEEWELRQQAFYTDLLFNREKSIEFSKQLVNKYPEDASAHFLLYHFLLKDDFNAATDQLQQAVRLDPIYGLEYLDLADWALNKKEGGVALNLLERARKAFPDDPFIKLRQATLLVMAGRGREALPQIKELKTLPWSEIYFAHIPAQLEQLEKTALNHSTPH